MNYGYEWKAAKQSIWDMLKTTVFPNIIWVIMINSILVSLQGAAGQVGSSILIAAGWKFETLGFAVIPIVIASPFVWFFGGYVADWISNFLARRNGGRREPEGHLVSLVFPLLASIVGPLLFGYAAENIRTLPSIVVLVSIFLIGFGLLTANTIFAVYLVESYPQFAGCVIMLGMIRVIPPPFIETLCANIYVVQSCLGQRLLRPPYHRFHHVLQRHHLDRRSWIPQELWHLQRCSCWHFHATSRHVQVRQADPRVDRRPSRARDACQGHRRRRPVLEQ